MSQSAQERGLLLRQALPYINKYRGKRFVFMVPISVIHKEYQDYSNVLGHDLAMCRSLGIHCVLCVMEDEAQDNKPLTDKQRHSLITKYNQLFTQCTSLVARGAYELAMRPAILQGNWILGRPQGVIDGVDMGYHGRVRNIDAAAMLGLLQQDYTLFTTQVVMDKQGNHYLLDPRNLVAELVRSLSVDKVIIYQPTMAADYSKRAIPRADAPSFIAELKHPLKKLVADMVHYCDMGANRVHLLPAYQEDALVNELLTAAGYGLMINADSYEELIEPHQHEMETIKMLITPLEEEGILRPRSLKQLQKKTHEFRIIKQDDHIIGCAALAPLVGEKGYAELQCVVVKSNYAGQGYGSRVLNSMENLARTQGYTHLVVLTTQAAQWFREKGFMPTKRQLPLSEVCCDRNAKVLIKQLSQAA